MATQNGTAQGLPVTSIPMDQIKVRPDFNSRAKGFINSTEGGFDENGDATTDGFKSLVASIRMSGQDTEVDIRPNTDKDSKKFPYVYITGHRRQAAIGQLHKEGVPIPFLPKGHIRVRIHPEMNDVDAISLNLRENIVRDNLSSAEKYSGVSKLFDADTDGKGGKLTQGQIIERTGLSVGYVSKLATVHALPKAVRKAWVTGSNSEGKGGPIHLPLETMRQIATQVPVERQSEVYDEKWAAKAPTSTGDGSGAGNNGDSDSTPPEERIPAWLATAGERTAIFGRQIGMLVKMKLFTRDEIESWTKKEWAQAVSYTIPNLGRAGKKPIVITEEQLASLGTKLKESYKLGRDAQIPGVPEAAGDEVTGDEDEDEDEEETETASASADAAS